MKKKFPFCSPSVCLVKVRDEDMEEEVEDEPDEDVPKKKTNRSAVLRYINFLGYILHI